MICCNECVIEYHSGFRFLNKTYICYKCFSKLEIWDNKYFFLYKEGNIIANQNNININIIINCLENNNIEYIFNNFCFL